MTTTPNPPARNEPVPPIRNCDPPALVAEIRREHEAAQGAVRTAVEHAIRCGQLLLRAKENVPHGSWGEWLVDNFPASQRTAQGYMRLAQRAEEAQGLADLGIEGVLRQLAKPKELSSAGDEFDSDYDWIYGTFEQVIQHVASLRTRKERLTALNTYQHAHRLPSTESDIVTIKALCAVVGDIQPIIETMNPAFDNAISHVWFGYLDHEEGGGLVYHPGWTSYCLAIGGPDGAPEARRLLLAVPDLHLPEVQEAVA